MKIENCPKCKQDRFNNSPVSYVWWSVMGRGTMCYVCFKSYYRTTKVGREQYKGQKEEM